MKHYPSLNNVLALAFAPDGGLWAGLAGGVVRWDLATGQPTHHFTTADGLGGDFVPDLAFGSDGVLWAATSGGVSRFDGRAWTTFTETDGVGNGLVNSVAVAPDGSIWAGTEHGLGHRVENRWEVYTTANGLPDDFIWDVGVAPDGTVWASTHAGGVVRFEPRTRRWTAFTAPEALPAPNARILAVAPDGSPWVHFGYDAVYRFDGRSWQQAYGAGGGQWVCDLAWDRSGQPWIATCGGWHAHGAGIIHWDHDHWASFTTVDGLADNAVTALALAADSKGTQGGGAVAAGSDHGLTVLQDGRWRVLREGPMRQRVTAAAVTADGEAWFGYGDWASQPAGGGLNRFDGRRWTTDAGLAALWPDANVQLLAVSPQGDLWAAAGCGLARRQDGVWRVMATCDLIQGGIYSLVFGPDGKVWVGSVFGLYAYDGRQWQENKDRLISALAVTGDGTVWAIQSSLRGGGLLSFDGQRWTEHSIPWPDPNSITSLTGAPDGKLWASTALGLLARFDGAAWHDLPLPARLVSNTLPRLVFAPDGSLWAAAQLSLARYDGQAWTEYDLPERLGGIQTLALAPDGALWIGTEQGVVHLRVNRR